MTNRHNLYSSPLETPATDQEAHLQRADALQRAAVDLSDAVLIPEIAEQFWQETVKRLVVFIASNTDVDEIDGHVNLAFHHDKVSADT